MTKTNNVQKWFAGIDVKEIDKKAQATVDYVKRFMKPDEDNEWTVFAHEIASGAHGQFTTRVFLDTVMNDGEEVFMTIEDQDILMGVFDSASTLVSDYFNHKTTLPGRYYVGHNEADGSLGVFYSVKAY